MDMRFGTWNDRNLYRAGSLKTVASKLTKCNCNLVAVQQVRWGKGDSEPADVYTHFSGNGNANHYLGIGFFIHQGIRSIIRGVEFVSNMMLNIIQGGHWCDVIILSMHAPTENKNDDKRTSFTNN
jgi:hypothetical protein